MGGAWPKLFSTVLQRIGLRGRDFERDEALVEYHRPFWSGNDEWVRRHYSASAVLVTDMNHTDVFNRPDDAARMAREVKDARRQEPHRPSHNSGSGRGL
ncbi:hypothetical protein [Streptomyces sp. NPDC004285]